MGDWKEQVSLDIICQNSIHQEGKISWCIIAVKKKYAFPIFEGGDKILKHSHPTLFPRDLGESTHICT